MSPAPERTVRLSVLDRLIDDAPKEAADAPGTWESSLSEMRASLMRDVEWLLNTRQVAEPPPDGLDELQRSIYSFGIPDVTSMSETEASRGALARAVAEAIQRFEPRLTAVRVTQKQGGPSGGRGLRFTVEALLRLDPSPERVAFDTVVETVSGRVLVAGEADA